MNIYNILNWCYVIYLATGYHSKIERGHRDVVHTIQVLGGMAPWHHGHDEKEPMKIGGMYTRYKAYSRVMFWGIYLQNMA